MAELNRYKCPACGGILKFSSSKQMLSCDSCGSDYPVEQFDASIEAQGDEYVARQDDWNPANDGLIVYECKSCGGEIVGDETIGSTKCPYCDNPIVISSMFKGSLKPDLIIPFKLNKYAATDKLKKHVNSIKLAPAAFKSDNHIQELKGVYVPFWLFDADVHARADFDTTKVHRHSDNQYDYEETEYYDVLREGNMSFRNIPSDGSKKMDDNLMDSIEPFNIEEAVPFSAAYLAGYMADKYDVTAEECKPRADLRIKNSSEQMLNDQVKGYDTKNMRRCDVQQSNNKVKYALFPVWLLNTTWNGKKYTFAMNGQTGTFVGDVPYSKGKFWGILLGVFAVLAGIMLGVSISKGGPTAGVAIVELLISLGIGALVAFIFKSGTKSVHKATQAASYLLKGSFKITRQYDNFLRKEEKKTPRNQNN
ncbi:MAG: hypothetical protein K6E28_09110 [Eubacterium sp.]|nr:hypothetical protein [Eubacterium sp.]